MRQSSIGRKLTSMIMFTTTCAVVLASAGYILADLSAMRSQQQNSMTVLARVISDNASASILFGDETSANEVLRALRAEPSVVAAGIYSNQGRELARYGPDPSIPLPRVVRHDGFHRNRNLLEMFSGIQLGGERIGTLYIATDARERNERLEQYALIAAAIVLISLLIAYLLSSRLQHRISAPIVELASVAAVVSRDKNFSVRVRDAALDESTEIGNLIAGFNGMLAEIEERDDSLLLHQTELEATVEARTGELVLAKNAAEKAAEANARLARETALILNTATDGIIVVNTQNRATFLNPAAGRMLGRELVEFEGKSIHHIIHPFHDDGTLRAEADCPLGQAVSRGDSITVVDDNFRRADGSLFPVEYSATPMLNHGGGKLGAVVMFRDVTERRAVERLKSEFVSTVSHELRTPLTSIRGALGLLGSGMLGPVAAEGKRMLAIAVSNTDRLVRLINDILDLERIDSGKVELVRGPVDANSVIVQALEGVQSMADQAGIELVHLPVNASLWGDSDRILQTLINLIGNAIKFSPRASAVTISGSVSDAEFVFCVADEGRGIPDGKLKTVFDRFSQVNASDSRDKNGSGLGLAICQSIVAAHGGKIWAEKNVPAGTRFRFTIPMVVAVPVDAAIIEPPVLVVEDDLDLARVIMTTLESHGIRTLHAFTGRDAIRLSMEHEPSLIVLDVVLPDTDGFAVVASLRESAAMRNTPLIIYAALEIGAADQSRLRLGPTEFLTKSRCSMAEFEGHVLRLLETVRAAA